MYAFGLSKGFLEQVFGSDEVDDPEQKDVSGDEKDVIRVNELAGHSGEFVNLDGNERSRAVDAETKKPTVTPPSQTPAHNPSAAGSAVASSTVEPPRMADEVQRPVVVKIEGEDYRLPEKYMPATQSTQGFFSKLFAEDPPSQLAVPKSQYSDVFAPGLSLPLLGAVGTDSQSVELKNEG